LRILRRLQREQAPRSPFVFTSERGAPLTTAGFARLVERAAVEAKLGFEAHPHMLRHAAGTRSRIEGMTRGRCRPISAMATSSTRCATPKCRRRGSKTFGGADLAACIPSSKVAGATGPRGLLSAMRPALASAPANPPSGTAAPTGNNGKSHRLKRYCSARLRRHTGVAARPLHCHRAVTASLFGREVAQHRLDCRSRPPRVGGHHPAPALTRNPSLTSSRETPLSCQSLDSPVKFSIAHGSYECFARRFQDDLRFALAHGAPSLQFWSKATPFQSTPPSCAHATVIRAWCAVLPGFGNLPLGRVIGEKSMDSKAQGRR
jgi:Phage integrase family